MIYLHKHQTILKENKLWPLEKFPYANIFLLGKFSLQCMMALKHNIIAFKAKNKKNKIV